MLLDTTANMRGTLLVGDDVYTVELSLRKMQEIVEKQITAEQKGQRYTPGTRNNPINWRNDPLLRVALAIGYSAYSMYWHSCVLRKGQRSDKHTAHRVSDTEFRHRVVRYVKLVMPKLGKRFGDELDGESGENASLWKKIYNVGLYAEFEHSGANVSLYSSLYAEAARLLLLSREQLREANIVPVTANGYSRGPNHSVK